jgi:CheY-like chemotaxis protein
MQATGDDPPPSAKGGTPAPDGARSAASPEGEAAIVLVVDDDAAVLQVVSKVLRRSGYKVLEAGGGPEAVRIVEAQEGRIDLLLTDVVMPGMGGREVSEAVGARCPGVKILFMSAYTEDEVILQGVRVAEVNFISKPFTVDKLRTKVRDVLDMGPASGPLHSI